MVENVKYILLILLVSLNAVAEYSDSVGVNVSGNPAAVANPLPVILSDGTNIITALKTQANTLPLSGTAAALNADAIVSTDVSSYTSIYVQLTGTFVATVTFQGSNDNTNFVSVTAQTISAATTAAVNTATTAGIWRVPVTFKYFRLRATAYTSGTVTATAYATTLTSQDLGNRSVAVTGTVTSNQGTAAAIANSWFAKLSDGVTGPVAVKAASTAPLATDISLVTTLSPNSNHATSANQSTMISSLSSIDSKLTSPITVMGSVGRTWSLLDSTDSVSAKQSGTWITDRSWSLSSLFDSVNIGNFPATQAISAISLPLPTGAATDSTLEQFQGPVSPGTPATKSALIGGIYNVTTPTLSSGQQGAIQLDSASRLLVNVGQMPGVAVVSLPSLPAGTNAIGSVTVTNSSAAPIYVTGGDSVGVFNSSKVLTVQSAGIGSPSQPITGSVGVTSISAGTNIIGKIIPTDGTNQITVKAASTSPAAADTAQVVALSPNGNQATESTLGSVSSSLTSILANQTNGNSQVQGTASMGSPATGNPLRMGGVYTQSVQNYASGAITDLHVDSRGFLITSNADGDLPTYSAAVLGLVSAITPSDIVTLCGSASKVVRVTRIAVTGTQSTAAQRDILLIKRSSNNTGGTSTLLTAVPHDSSEPAATATMRSYTVNPTALGTSVGTTRTRKVYVGTTTGNSDEFITEFGTRSGQSLVLRGTSQCVVINLNGVTSSGSSWDISAEWTEE